MYKQSIKQFFKAYTIALLMSITSMLVGSAIAVDDPRYVYIPYVGAPSGAIPGACALAHEDEMLSHARAEGVNVTLAVYRTAGYSGCKQSALLFI